MRGMHSCQKFHASSSECSDEALLVALQDYHVLTHRVPCIPVGCLSDLEFKTMLLMGNAAVLAISACHSVLRCVCVCAS